MDRRAGTKQATIATPANMTETKMKVAELVALTLLIPVLSFWFLVACIKEIAMGHIVAKLWREWSCA